MKKIDLVITKQNNVDVVRYELKSSDVYDERVEEKINQASNIVPFQYSDEDGKRSITSYVKDGISINVMLKKVLDKKSVLAIISGLAGAFEVGAQGVPVSYIIKNLDNVYVDENNYSVKCLLLPIKQDVMPMAELPMMFREVLSKIRYNEDDKDNYAARLITFVNSDDFSVSKLKEIADKELEMIGYYVSKEKGLTSMNEGNAPVMGSGIRVNKLGVMNNMMGGRPPMMGNPAGGNPVGQAPAGQMPAGPMPGVPPMMGNPGRPMPVGQAPMGQMPVGQTPVGQAPMGQMPTGAMPGVPPMMGNPGRPMPAGQTPMGQAPVGQAPMGQMPTGAMPGVPPMMGNPGRPMPAGQAPAGQMPAGPMPGVPPMMGNPGRPMPAGQAPTGQMPAGPMPGMPPMMGNPAGGNPVGQAPTGPMPGVPPMMGNPAGGNLVGQAPIGQMPAGQTPTGPIPGVPPVMANPDNQSAPSLDDKVADEQKAEENTSDNLEKDAPAVDVEEKSEKTDSSNEKSKEQTEEKSEPATPEESKVPEQSGELAKTGKLQGVQPLSETPNANQVVPPMPGTPNANPLVPPMQGEFTMGSLVGQLGIKPVPHIVRKKTGEAIGITKNEFSIGKSKQRADYSIENNPAISRIHCTIIQRDGVNYIVDNNSTNHTYVNGVELEPGKDVLLKNKSIIQLGDEEFTFLLRKGD